MDARPKTRRVNRERNAPATQSPRGAKQIVIPMTRQQSDEIWDDAQRTRAVLTQSVQSAPELFPPGFDRGYRLLGFGRPSRKLPGIKLRKLVTAEGVSYWLRPSFVTGYMTGTVEELAYPLLLVAHGVPAWLLAIGFGHSEMFWHRVVERLGRNSLGGATVRDPARLPEHLAADEHHADWAGRKGYVATTVGGGCLLGVALTAGADDAHLREAYGVFAAEARDVDPEYAPLTVNTDGWAATRNAFCTLFPTIAVVLCQADPRFQADRLVVRISAAEVRRRLISEKGYTDEELPTPQTINTKLNMLGYRLTKVAKCRPQYESRRPTPSSRR